MFKKYFDSLAGLAADLEIKDAKNLVVGADDAMKELVRLFREKTALGGKLMFIGNGGSAGICSHQATDYSKNGRMRSVAFNDPSLLTCLSNDYGYEHVFEKAVENYADKTDVLIAISSSGKSVNILGGVKAAREKGCAVVTLSGFGQDNPLRRTGDINFYVPSPSYGFVEISHLAILHCILDYSIDHPASEENPQSL